LDEIREIKPDVVQVGVHTESIKIKEEEELND